MIIPHGGKYRWITVSLLQGISFKLWESDITSKVEPVELVQKNVCNFFLTAQNLKLFGQKSQHFSNDKLKSF